MYYDAPVSVTEPPVSIRVDAGAVELGALDYGSAHAGTGAAPTMLLVHGMRDLAWSMDSIAQAFRDRYRVVSLDLRGHGDSQKPGVYTMQHLTADLFGAVRALELDRCVLVGHSLGGQVVAQYAALAPEHASACVLIEGLGAPPREGEDSAAGRRQMARFQLESLATPTRPARRVADLNQATERILQNHPRLAPERARFLAEVGTSRDPAGGLRWKWDPAVQMIWSTYSRDQVEERWRSVECPTLVVAGEVSGESWWYRLGPRSSPDAARGYLPAAELERRLGCFRDHAYVEIPEAGHMIHFDQPEHLNREIDAFLGQATQSGRERE